MYGAVDLHDCWGVDTVIAGALTDEQLRALAEATLPNGQPVKFLWMYVPLSGNRASHWDASADRMRAACDAGLIVMLVQHCRSGLWTASAELGQADGEEAGVYASDLGYPTDAYIALDDESVANTGKPVTDHLVAWCEAVKFAGRPCIYEGFSPGLSPSGLYGIPNVDRYWGAAGPWNVDKRGVCCRQFYPPVKVAGIVCDMDHAFPDKLGGTLRGMGRIDAE